MTEYLRTLTDVMKDGLWPDLDPFGPDSEKDGRHQAIAEVLLAVPEEDYQVLKDRANWFEWFIPDLVTRAGVFAFTTNEPDPDDESHQPQAVLLYLSATLERATRDVVVEVVAHELAHIALRHPLDPGTAYDAQEKAAWARAAQWGFADQVRKVLRVHKWRDSFDAQLARKLRRAK